MDIFSVYDYHQPTGSLGNEKRAKGQKVPQKSKDQASAVQSEAQQPGPVRPTKEQIRQKVEALKAQRSGAKVDISKKAQRQAQMQNENPEVTSLAEEGEVENKGSQKETIPEAMNAIKKNDPADPTTSEKLKHILKSGSFSFAPNERKVLEDILGS